MTVGGRNLAVLGIISVVVAAATTGVSLLIYHNSGDIYLDRSRPGYLPDEEEIIEGLDEDYEFDKSGEITAEVLDEYLKKLEVEVRGLEAYGDAFLAEALSDERLGISGEM